MWVEAFRVERRGVDLLAGLAGGLATCAPLVIGVATGEPEIGVTACFGGLNAALGVPRGPLRDRLGWGTGAALACCAAVAIATAVQEAIGEPPILLVDDPYSALDPTRRDRIATMLADREGQVVISVADEADVPSQADAVLDVRAGTVTPRDEAA